MSDASGLLIAKSDKNLYLLPKMANRHGLIAGATGTGKTVSLQVMAEGFSAAGVPVFMADGRPPPRFHARGDRQERGAGHGQPDRPLHHARRPGRDFGRPPLTSDLLFW